ncbi:MAG: glycosyltransferase family 9 protein [Burkholderiaceae bacterium]
MSAAWQQARNLLCIRLDYLGDVLMTTPALRALKESVPGRRITLMTSAGGAAVAPYLPEVDDVIVYDAPWLKNGAPHDAADDLAMVHCLRERGFDGVVIFTVYSQNPLPSALLCYLAGMPLALAHCRENPYRLLSDWVRETEPEQTIRHEVRRQLDLVAAIGCTTANERLSFAVPDADREWAHDWLRRHAGDGPAIVLHPGASAASRRYPAEHWIEVARGLRAALPDCTLVFTGSAGESMLIDGIRDAAGVPSLSLAGGLDLGRLAAIVAESPLLVSNNTGPAHLAAAVGTPVVNLYALTNPQHAPWQVPSRVLYRDVPCRFCYKSVCPQGHLACLSQVAPQEVVDAALALLDGASMSDDASPLALMRRNGGSLASGLPTSLCITGSDRSRSGTGKPTAGC